MELQDLIDSKIIDTKTIDITLYHIIVTLIIILSTWLLLKLVRKLFNRQVNRGKVDRGSATSLFLIIKYFAWVIVIGIILETVGIKLTLLIAGSAALLVGLGLGLQQIFRDIVSGFFMLFERNLKIGDVIELEGKMIGKVEQIGLRTSKVRTRDNIITTVPNSKFIDNRVINWTLMEEKTRFHVEVGVAYGSNTRLVEKVLLNCAKESKDICNEPKPFVRFNAFGNSSLDFQLFFWTTESFWVENIKSNLRFAIDKAFAENNITIPFPQHDIHIKTDLTK
jgi:small-conductance mechanosensitive channel